MRLTWSDLLIEDIASEDAVRWLDDWQGVIDGTVAPIFLNKFGSWFLRRPDGRVEMLDVFTGLVEQVAETQEQFVANVNEPWWQEIYLLSESVFRLHEAGKIPGPGECYAVAPHPAFGGPNPTRGELIDPRCVMVMGIAVWQSICAQVVGGGRTS